MHDANVASFLAGLLVILLSAKFFGELAERLGQPAVLGELLGGVVLGFGLFSVFRPDDPTLGLMAQFGVVLLLFETGLHSDLTELMRVGALSLAVATAGMALPFVLGWGLMTALGHGGVTAVVVGAALTATSVGITARVLSDLGRLDRPEARVILGAAVIDDILGIILLSAVEVEAGGGAFSWAAMLRSAGMAVLFVAAALWLGPVLARRLARLVPKLKVRGVLITAAVGFAFALSLLAHELGSALIVGAFTAGALLAQTDRKADFAGALAPLADVFVPVFFVMVGAKVRLDAYNPFVPGHLPMLGLAAGLAAVAVAGKLAAGWVVWPTGLDRFAIGAGMLPRGEVGLIFAQIGLASGALGDPLYAAVVGMVVATTFLAPPLLRRAFA